MLQVAHPSPARGETLLLESDRAVQLGRVGLKKFAAHEWLAAYEDFQAAEKIAHSPVFVLYMARCKRELGEWLAARSLYRTAIEHELDSTSPAPFREAVADGRAELLAMDRAIPSVILNVSPSAPGTVWVELDGQRLADAELSAPIPLNPGSHTLKVANESQRVSLTIALQPGQVEVPVRVELTPREPPAPMEGPPAPGGSDGSAQQARPPPDYSAVARPASGLRVPTLISFAVGAAGAIVGATTGLLAWQQVRLLQERCPDYRCPASERPLADSAQQLANISTVAFVLGGLGVGVGVGLSLVPPRREGGVSTSTTLGLSLGGTL